nr:MAG TPA_asm: hypothetical protein [Caudoviricetes sp.]
MNEEKKQWGGRRAGAGRPKGTTKGYSIQRKQHQVRAFEDEWDIIKRFSKLVKTSKKEECLKAVEALEENRKI